MVINVNLTPDELQALYKTSALTGLSIDEIIHSAIIKAISEQIPSENNIFRNENKTKQKVYKPGVDPYASVFDESDWQMLTETEEINDYH